MSAKWVNLIIDGKQVRAPAGKRLIDVAENEGVGIPRFCYHPDLTVVASCRMCLVEIEGVNKPQPSCSTAVAEGMVVKTQSKNAVDAQKAMMRFLLMKHPLHCPICDQGGECELQDVAMGYGDGIADYSESKRDIDDEDLGPLVATDMSLCIHCTRCVRFGEEVAGQKELALVGRGDGAMISTYLAKGLRSEWSGNMIDLCPVGALTSKPAKFSGRSWSYVEHPVIAVHDCVGAHMSYHTAYKGFDDIYEVKRAVPRSCPDINHIWLSDRDRFSYEGLHVDRVTEPMQKIGDSWYPISYEQALVRISEILDKLSTEQKKKSLVCLSPQTSCEDGAVLANFFRKMGLSNIDIASREKLYDQGLPMPISGATPTDIEEAQTILLLGCALRWDQPYLSLRVKKAQQKGAKVLSLGSIKHHYAYDVDHCLVSGQSFVRSAMKLLHEWGVSDVVPKEWGKHLTKSRVVVLLGEEALSHPQGQYLNHAVQYHANRHVFQYAFLPQGANIVGLYQRGCIPFVDGELVGKRWFEIMNSHLDFVWLQQVDPQKDLDADPQRLKTAFVVACVSHLTPAIDACADLILPNDLPGEQGGTYVNYHGLVQYFDSTIKRGAEQRSLQEVMQGLAILKNIESLAVDYVHQDVGELEKPDVVEGLMDKSYPLVLTHWMDTDIWLRHAQSLQKAYPMMQNVMVHRSYDASGLEAEGHTCLVSEDVAKDTVVLYRNSAAHVIVSKAVKVRDK